MVPTLVELAKVEGVAGLYRGFVPRALHMVPVLMTFNYVLGFSR